jgi:hypothetical protein
MALTRARGSAELDALAALLALGMALCALAPCLRLARASARAAAESAASTQASANADPDAFLAP